MRMRNFSKLPDDTHRPSAEKQGILYVGDGKARPGHRLDYIDSQLEAKKRWLREHTLPPLCGGDLSHVG